MLSNIIVNVLDGDDSIGLTKGVDLFAERGAGDRYAVVRAYSVLPLTDFDVIRTASVQILLNGWTYDEGYALCEKILGVVQAMSGGYSYKNETYLLQSVVLRRAPDAFRYPTVLSEVVDVLGFSINFQFYYQFSIN